MNHKIYIYSALLIIYFQVTYILNCYDLYIKINLSFQDFRFAVYSSILTGACLHNEFIQISFTRYYH